MEKLEIYDLEGNLLRIEDRIKYYQSIKDEFSSSGNITTQIKAIRIVVISSKGRIYLQKRSRQKSENPGLYDKTVGGHVSVGENEDLTLVRECAEELGFPVSIVRGDEQFEKAALSTNLEIVCLAKKLETISQFMSVRRDKEGNNFAQPIINTFYLGYYDGSLKFVDGESCGIEVFSLEELENAIEKNPEQFTSDIQFILNKYKSLLKPLGDKANNN